jgi:hypothetical protein
LDAFSHGLRSLPEVRLERLPRMLTLLSGDGLRNGVVARRHIPASLRPITGARSRAWSRPTGGKIDEEHKARSKHVGHCLSLKFFGLDGIALGVAAADALGYDYAWPQGQGQGQGQISMELNQELLDRFLTRILELHKAGIVSEIDARTTLAEAIVEASVGNLNLNKYMETMLGKAWSGDNDA